MCVLTRISRSLPLSGKLGIIVLSVLAILLNNQVEAAIPQSERDALIALYMSTEGWNWNRNDGWLGGTGTECDWWGVECDATESYVERIGLSENNLVGPIPPELGDLTHLVWLYLDFNKLSGSIPPELGLLTGLQGLILYQNHLTGEIPPELANLTELQLLGLADNLLTGEIPAWLGNLQDLGYLALQHNRLSGSIPPQIGNLTNLYALYLNMNRFQGEIPVGLMNLAGTNQISIGGNYLFTTNPALAAFLDDHAYGWRCQAWPPSDLHIISLWSRFADVGWTPICWTNSGAYEVLISTSSGGPYERVPSTAIQLGKETDKVVIGPLEPDTSYFLVARSINLAGKSTLASWPSEELEFSTPQAVNLYVSTTGGDLNDCLSSSSPCRTIQSAIDKANDGDAVVVAPGTYSENVWITKNVVIGGSPFSPTVIDGQESGSSVFVGSGLRVALHDLWITNGSADDGGGVFNLGSYLFLLSSQVLDNSALFAGGGVYNDGGILVIEDSTIANNTADSGAAVDGDFISLWNSTISGNISTGLFSKVVTPDFAPLLWNSTVAGNQAGDYGTVLRNLTLSQHTILANNLSPACSSQASSLGHCLSDTDDCLPDDPGYWDYGNGDLPSTDPMLGPLMDNGGPTHTHALLSGSPAIDAGDNEGAPLTDQRGGERPVDGDGIGGAIVDIGSYEYGATAQGVIFWSGFESGDTSEWSATVP